MFMVKKFQAQVYFSLILLLFCNVLFAFFPQNSVATGPVCCWSPQNVLLTGNVAGKIVAVKKAEQILVIRVNDKDINFKFEASGSDKQKNLLSTLKVGDTVTGTAMDAEVQQEDKASGLRMNRVLMTSESSKAKKSPFYHFRKKQRKD